MIDIHTNGQIAIDGRDSGLGVTQRRDCTVVYTRENGITGAQYAEHKMPHPRYSLAHDQPASGAPGRAQFDADLLALVERLA